MTHNDLNFHSKVSSSRRDKKKKNHVIIAIPDFTYRFNDRIDSPLYISCSFLSWSMD